MFCVAARLSSFKQAASELFITASAVSHQIRSLEERIGFELFERRTRAVTLTTKGVALLEAVAPLLDEIYAQVNQIAESQNTVSLRLILPPFFATEIFIPRLAEFTERHPNIDIYLDMADVRPSTLSFKADVAVLLCETPPADRHSELLFELELVPACAPSYSQNELNEPEIDYDTSTLIVHRHRREAWKRWFRKAGLESRTTSNIFELDSMSAVVQSAEQGVGVALVPRLLAASRFASGKLLRLPGKGLLTGDQYHICWQKNSPHKKEMAALVEWIREIT